MLTCPGCAHEFDNDALMPARRLEDLTKLGPPDAPGDLVRCPSCRNWSMRDWSLALRTITEHDLATWPPAWRVTFANLMRAEVTP